MFVEVAFVAVRLVIVARVEERVSMTQVVKWPMEEKRLVLVAALEKRFVVVAVVK